MKILITGADGFIGSHLTEMLFAKGDDPHEVIRWLESQSGRKANPQYYARRTVEKALKLKGDVRFGAV